MDERYKQALMLAQEGEWDAAHGMVQSATDRLSCLIHAYLHRVEGDFSNARYWYQRGGEEMSDDSLRNEWQRLYDLVDGS